MACKEIKIRDTPSLRDAFVAEVVVLSPPDLTLLDLSGSSNLHKVMLSPMTACPKLNEVNLNNCRALDYVLIQSQSATRIDISKCGAVTKVLLHCPNLQTVCLTDCPNLHTVMLWSDQLKELDLTGCTGVHSLKLQCPALESRTIPPLVPPPPMQKPIHPPFSAMLRENLKEAAQAAAQMRESDTRTIKDDSIIPRVYR